MKLGLRTYQTDPNNLASENFFIDSVSSPFFSLSENWMKFAFRPKFIRAAKGTGKRLKPALPCFLPIYLKSDTV